jgi:hypothetical protein
MDEEIRDLLSTVLLPEFHEAWYNLLIPELGRTPRAAVEDGDRDAVMTILFRFQESSFG